jgi:hypothetical protein
MTSTLRHHVIRCYHAICRGQVKHDFWRVVNVYEPGPVAAVGEEILALLV